MPRKPRTAAETAEIRRNVDALKTPSGETSSQLRSLGCDDSFILESLESGLTYSQARDRWMAELPSRQAAELAKVKADTAAMQAKLQGVEDNAVGRIKQQRGQVGCEAVSMLPSPTTYRASGAAAQWERELHSRLQSGMSFVQASDAIDRDYPGLRAKMVAEDNGRSSWDEAKECTYE